MQDSHNSWTDCTRSRHCLVLARQLYPALKMAILDEWAHNTSTAKADKTKIFKKIWHMNNPSFKLCLIKFLRNFCSILVSPGKTPKFCNKYHGVSCNIHVETSKIKNHRVDVLAAQIGHKEPANIILLR